MGVDWVDGIGWVDFGVDEGFDVGFLLGFGLIQIC